MAAAAGRDQDCGRVAALLVGDGCTGAYAYGNWVLEKGQVYDDCDARAGETRRNKYEPSLCNLSPLSLGSSCLRGGGWSAKNWM